MGLKTIDAKKEELLKKTMSLQKFKAAAAEFVAGYAKIGKAMEDLDKLRENGRTRLQTLETFGIKEFEDYKKHLAAVYDGYNNRTLPFTPLDAAIKREKDQVDTLVKDWAAKQAAAFPSEVKPGMVFIQTRTRAMFEVIGGAEKSTNPNLIGDKAVFHNIKWASVSGAGKGSSITLAEMKQSCKFVKT